MGILEEIFPELAESEDERIRQKILFVFYSWRNNKQVNIPNKKEVEKAISWLEKQRMSYTKRDVDDAYLEGVRDTKNEMEKQYEANYQIRKDIATFIFNYRGDIKDRAKWMDYLGFKVSFVGEQGEQEKDILEDAILDGNEDGLVAETIRYKNEKQGEQRFADTDNKFIRMRETKPKDISEFLDRLTTVEQEFLWEHIAKIRELDKEEQKSADEVEPKFNECEWITNGDYTWKIVEVKPLDYILQSQDGNIVDDTISHVDEQFHSFTTQDAKGGDVLCDYIEEYDNPLIFILKKFERVNFGLANISDYSSYCFLTAGDRQRFEEGQYHHKHNIKPATKEQRDTLLKAMADAGYTFDFEKKELKKITQEPEENKGNVGGISPNWSEEDEEEFQIAIDTLVEAGQHDSANWLQSLKGIAQPKQEWSEEEENRFAKVVLSSCASSFIDYLDAHKYEGKMCVSNGECQDIENAFHNAMWDRLHRYYCKYIEKQGEQKPNPYSGVSFEYNGHIWGMCARDGGVEILMDGNITSRVFHDKNNIIEQKPTDSYCQENCKGFQETGKCFADGECKAKREAEQKSVTWSEEEIEKAAQEWDSKANFNPFYMTMESDKPTGVKQHITTHKESFKAGVNWILKSLKGRVQSKQEWSEEDEEILRTILSDGIRGAELDMLQVNWLKSLRPQNRWKPSEEQMEALWLYAEQNNYDGAVLTSLYNDLKKLKEK